MIDIHTHVFNLAYLPVHGILRENTLSLWERAVTTNEPAHPRHLDRYPRLSANIKKKGGSATLLYCPHFSTEYKFPNYSITAGSPTA